MTIDIPHPRFGKPFLEGRDVRRPWAITVRGGRNHLLVQTLRFSNRQDAEAFRQEHTS